MTRCQTLAAFLDELNRQDELLEAYDPLLWRSLLAYGTVTSYDEVRFTYKSETEVNI